MKDYMEIDNKINVKEGDLLDGWGDNILVLRILDINQDPYDSNICDDCKHKNFCLKKDKYSMRFPKSNKRICMAPGKENIQLYEEINNIKIPKEKMDHPIVPFITKFKNGQLLKYKNTFLRVNYYNESEPRCKKCFFKKKENDECEASIHLICGTLEGARWAYEEVSEIENSTLKNQE